jgi:hypothetical protein
MPPAIKAMLCILALLPLAESSTPAPAPALADALADACMAEPEAIARALTEVVRINPISAGGGWLVDLRGFDGPERQELSDLLRGEGVGLGDRSKLRRLVAAAAAQSIVDTEDDAVIGMLSRRTQQADERGEPATNTQLKKQQGDHAGTAQPSSGQANDDSGLSGDSASPYLRHSPTRLVAWATCTVSRSGDFRLVQVLISGARFSNCAAGHGGPRGRGLRGGLPHLDAMACASLLQLFCIQTRR